MMVFWDMIAGVYDLFEKLYNGRCYDGTGTVVLPKLYNEDQKALACRYILYPQIGQEQLASLSLIFSQLIHLNFGMMQYPPA